MVVLSRSITCLSEPLHDCVELFSQSDVYYYVVWMGFNVPVIDFLMLRSC